MDNKKFLQELLQDSYDMPRGDIQSVIECYALDTNQNPLALLKEFDILAITRELNEHKDLADKMSATADLTQNEQDILHNIRQDIKSLTIALKMTEAQPF